MVSQNPASCRSSDPTAASRRNSRRSPPQGEESGAIVRSSDEEGRSTVHTTSPSSRTSLRLVDMTIPTAPRRRPTVVTSSLLTRMLLPYSVVHEDQGCSPPPLPTTNARVSKILDVLQDVIDILDDTTLEDDHQASSCRGLPRQPRGGEARGA
jgi:hypothetical protein